MWREELRSGGVSYHVIQPLKNEILVAAYRRFIKDGDGDIRRSFAAFKEAEAAWLSPYTLYHILVGRYHGDTRRKDWRPEHRTYPTALHWLQMQPITKACQHAGMSSHSSNGSQTANGGR